MNENLFVKQIAFLKLVFYDAEHKFHNLIAFLAKELQFAFISYRHKTKPTKKSFKGFINPESQLESLSIV